MRQLQRARVRLEEMNAEIEKRKGQIERLSGKEKQLEKRKVELQNQKKTFTQKLSAFEYAKSRIPGRRERLERFREQGPPTEENICLRYVDACLERSKASLARKRNFLDCAELMQSAVDCNFKAISAFLSHGALEEEMREKNHSYAEMEQQLRSRTSAIIRYTHL